MGRLLGIVFVAAAVLLVSAAVLGQPSAEAQPAQVSASVGSTPAGQALRPGFVGVSLEYSALHLYTGRDPAHINPVLIALLRGISPGAPPVIRIGGDSADQTWWPMRGWVPPGGVKYALTPGWMRTTKALASTLGAHLVMDLNLAANRPALAVAEARALVQGIGRQYIQDMEVGNEPDVYSAFSWYRNRKGKPLFARPPNYNLASYNTEFEHFGAALPTTTPLAGPAFAELTWLPGLGSFVSGHRRLGLVTVHRYPLRAGITDPGSTLYPSTANLLGDGSSAGVAREVAPGVSLAHAAGHQFRVDELNSASHSGQPGLSDTFASALWVLDTLFNLAGVGVDGVNIHTLPGAAYELFTFSQPRGTWQAFVHPEYYGLMMFAQAFPTGAQLLPVASPGGPLKVWATHAPDGHTRVVAINKDPANSYQLQVQVPGADIAGAATLEWLQAPSVSSTSGVTLGGQSFGTETRSGTLGPPQTQPVLSVGGSYTLQVPAASAVLLTQ